METIFLSNFTKKKKQKSKSWGNWLADLNIYIVFSSHFPCTPLSIVCLAPPYLSVTIGSSWSTCESIKYNKSFFSLLTNCRVSICIKQYRAFSVSIRIWIHIDTHTEWVNLILSINFTMRNFILKTINSCLADSTVRTKRHIDLVS